MPQERKVRDLMIPIEKYSTIKANAMVGEAISVLQKTLEDRKAHRALLVINDAGSAVGVLTFRDLIKALEPHALSADIPRGSIDWLLADNDPEVYPEELFAQRSKLEANKTVREIMENLNLITIQTDAPILKAVHMMVHHGVGCLPVLDGERVVGMIQINEIFREVANVITTPEGG